MTLFAPPSVKDGHIVPRPYQEEALESLDSHIRAKESNPCVVIPTGGGKSVLIAWTLQNWKRDYPPFRCIILAHRKELVSQNAQELLSLWPTGDIGIYSAGLRRRDSEHSILFASIDSVWNKWGNFAPWDCIMVDEAHRIPAAGEGKYREFIKGSRITSKNLRVVGWTATPYRMGCGPICHKDHILNEICYESNVGDLIAQGFLCKLRSKVGDEQPDLEKVKRNHGGDYIVKSLAEVMDKDDVVSKAIHSAMGHIGREGRKSCIWFCVDVEHCRKVSAELRKYGVDAPVVTANTGHQDRDRIAEAFKAGRHSHLCNVNVYTEGFNAKRVDCIVLLRPTLSMGLYCLDEQTEILTINGWAKDAHPGTVCAVFDADTRGIRYEPAIATMRRTMNPGEIFYSIQSPMADIRVTSQHRMVARTSKLRPWKIRSIEEVASLSAGVYLPTSGVFCGLPGLPLIDDELRFIGWVMTDGCINKCTNAVAITQGEHQSWVKDIENCLRGCGFKYTKSIRVRKSQFRSSSPAVLFTISKGKPRGRDKHLRGWGALEPYLSKDFSPRLNELTEKQFDVLLHAIHLGDGSKQINQAWTRRSYHISSGNKTFAERLQIAGVTHGYRASLALHNYNKNPLYIIHLKKIDSINVSSTYDTRPRWTVSVGTGEKCWCVQTPTGTLITRRNGKVVILGNSQMVGRGLRVHPDKPDCLVLDYAHCIDEHGPIDCLDAGTVKLAKCQDCGDTFSRAIRKCPHCGWEIPPQEIERMEAEEREKKMHEAEASNRAILGTLPETVNVSDVTVHRHSKPGSPDSIRVQYRCGLSMFREWLCLDHGGYAEKKARRWWWARFGRGEAEIVTVDSALTDMLLGHRIAEATKTITVVRRGKYSEIIGYELKNGATA